jgi:F-type H+-transporting ATPase subunit alpha
MTLDKGRKNNQLLIQPQYSPMRVGDQVAILYCGTHALMKDIPLDRVREFQGLFLDRMHASHADVLDALADGKLDDNLTGMIESTAAAVIASM